MDFISCLYHRRVLKRKVANHSISRKKGAEEKDIEEKILPEHYHIQRGEGAHTGAYNRDQQTEQNDLG